LPYPHLTFERNQPQAMAYLQEEGVLSETTGRSWGRIYLARPILEIIEDRM